MSIKRSSGTYGRQKSRLKLCYRPVAWHTMAESPRSGMIPTPRKAVPVTIPAKRPFCTPNNRIGA